MDTCLDGATCIWDKTRCRPGHRAAADGLSVVAHTEVTRAPGKREGPCQKGSGTLRTAARWGHGVCKWHTASRKLEALSSSRPSAGGRCSDFPFQQVGPKGEEAIPSEDRVPSDDRGHRASEAGSGPRSLSAQEEEPGRLPLSVKARSFWA